MLQTTISIFNGVLQKRGKTIKIGDVVEKIRTGSDGIKELVADIRNPENLARKKELKEKLLAVTFSGLFDIKEDAALLQHSGLICLDFDHENTEHLRDILNDKPYTFLSFVSPSGDGLKVVVAIADGSKHRQYFNYLRTLYPTLDRSGVNESRLCFLSYDPEIYVNESAIPIELPAEFLEEKLSPKPLPKSEYGTMREERIIKDIYNHLLTTGHSITYDYPEWCKVGWALINTFDFGTACELFCLLSSIDVAKYDRTACMEQMEKLRRGNKQRREFGHIVSAATLTGWNNKNEFVKKGVSQNPPTPSQPEKKNGVAVGEVGGVSKKRKANPELPFLYVHTTAKGDSSVRIDSYKLLRYMEDMGFGKMKFQDGGFRFYQVKDGGKIKEVEIADMTGALRVAIDALPEWMAVDNGAMDVHKDQLHGLVFKELPNVFSEKKLNYTKQVEKDFLRDIKEFSYFTFQNKIVAVSGSDISTTEYANCGRLIWEDDVVAHDIEVAPLVGVEQKSCEFGEFVWYLVGRNEARFKQIRTAIGYALRTYRDPSVAVAIVLTEEKVMDGVADGGTGKGVFSKALEYMRSVYMIDGKRNKVDSQFSFQRYDLRNTIISYQDGEFDAGLNKLFVTITDGLTVERKNIREVFLPFKASKPGQFEAPMWVITTNKPIKMDGNSDRRRLFICEVSSHWKDNSIHDHFKHNLYYDWDYEEFNKFYNFMFRCVQEFLNCGLYRADTVNSDLNNLISITNKRFVDWWHEFLYSNKMWLPNQSSLLGDSGHKCKPFLNRNDYYKQVADYCGWGYVGLPDRIEITTSSLKGSNNAVLKWLETACRQFGIGYKDRAKGKDISGKQVSTFEFTLDKAAMDKVKRWLTKFYHIEAEVDEEELPEDTGIYGGQVEIDYDDLEEAPF